MKQTVKVKAKTHKKPVVSEAVHAQHGHTCLNCNHPVSGNYCSACGQRADTHRLSIEHFAVHDLVHSIWHVDRGIFFTLREVLIRPGYAALNYIRGKRAGKFPMLTLLLILLGLIVWVNSFIPDTDSAIEMSGAGPDIDNALKMANYVTAFIHHNTKWILLGMLPITALGTLVVFHETYLNYTEHLVVNGYVFGGILVIVLVAASIEVLFPATSEFMDRVVGFVGLAFYITGFWQAYHQQYRVSGFIWRMAVLIIFNVFLQFITLMIGLIVIALMLRIPMNGI